MAERTRLVIAGGTVIDATGERPADVLVGPDGTIAAVGEGLAAGVGGADRILDARGCIVAPGLVDLHAHLRQPGGEQAETVESGSRAAVLGGFCAVVAMPNTNPSIDSAALVREVQELGPRVALPGGGGRRHHGRPGGGAPRPHGVRWRRSESGSSPMTAPGCRDTAVMRRALEYASDLGVRLAQHCEVDSLAAGGHMHEGEWSSRLGIPGIPAEAEEIMVMRDVALSRLTGAPVHFQHLSTAGSVAIVEAARRSGLAVTAEVAPHHFTLTDESCASYDSRFKVNPPLRPADDVAAVRTALARGSLDAIATDHAPHTSDAKDRAFEEAPPGMLGLETALALAPDGAGSGAG